MFGEKTMVIYILKFMVLAGLLSSALFTASLSASTVVKASISIVLEDGDCRISCTADLSSNGGPLTFNFKSYERGYDMFIDLWIGGREFKELIIDRTLIKDGLLPFYKYEFPQHTLYGLDSSISAHNSYVHYFTRSNNGLNHLGHFPYLSYDTKLGLFVGFLHANFHGKMGSTRQYYRLQGNRLVEEEDF